MQPSVRLYHNPKCSKSRQALLLLQQQGLEHEVIEYLQNPLTARDIEHLLVLLQIPAHDLLRKTEQQYKDLGLTADTNQQLLITALANNPQLLQRPIIVVENKHAVIARPAEKLLELL